MPTAREPASPPPHREGVNPPRPGQGPTAPGPGRVPAAAGPGVSVIVPVFNERDTIGGLLERLLVVLKGQTEEFEILLVDDGSSDDTFSRVRQRYSGEPRIRILHLTKNFGQQQAVMAGFHHCRGRRVVTIDADLQNPPEEIPKLLDKLEEGYDVVCGWRRERRDPWLRRLSSNLLNRIVSRLTGVHLHDYGCMLRAYRRRIIERVKQCPERSTYITALVCWVGGRFTEVEVRHEAREAGRSKYNYWKLFELYFNLLTGFSILPLQVISFLGMACSSFGFALAGWLVARRVILGNDIVGVTSVFAVLFFLFGLLIFSLGLIGEYIGRIYIEVQGRPAYLVQEVVELGSLAPPPDRSQSRPTKEDEDRRPTETVAAGDRGA